MTDNLYFLRNMMHYHRNHMRYLDNILFLHYCNNGNEYPGMDTIYDEYQHHADRKWEYQLAIDAFYDASPRD